MTRRRWFFALLLVSALALAACGGGGGDDEPDPKDEDTPTAAPTTVTPEVLTPQQIVEKFQKSVVHIRANYPEGLGGGTGIVWQDATHIVTNAHVVLGAGSIKVVDPVDKREIPARVVALSQCDDVALLEVDRGNFEPATLGDSAKLATGEEVIALGFPGTATDPSGDSLTVTRGIVSKLGDSFDGLQDLIQTDAAINPGNSGGPLVNLRGEVIGMNTLSSVSRQNINYAISITEVGFVAEKLELGKNIDYLGARLEQNYRGLAEELGIQLAYIDGILVTGVDAGSPAEDAGLGYSDLIYYIDNVYVETVGDVCDILRSRTAGDTIHLQITRTYSDGTFEDLSGNLTLE
jgi:serine protease Do